MGKGKASGKAGGGCAPCEPYEPYKPPKPGPYTKKKEKLPTNLHEALEAFEHLNDRLDDWERWAVGVNDTLQMMVRYIHRLEHAVCCLEGHVVYGRERPDDGLICDDGGAFRSGTFHEEAPGTWPITDPPDEPWE